MKRSRYLSRDRLLGSKSGGDGERLLQKGLRLRAGQHGDGEGVVVVRLQQEDVDAVGRRHVPEEDAFRRQVLNLVR